MTDVSTKTTMVQFLLRFYGRFLFVRDRKGDDTKRGVTILAPTLEFPPEVCRHIPVLTVDRAAVAGSQLLTTVPPTWRAIPGPTPETAEYLMWDLSGSDISLAGEGGVDFREEMPVPNLADLEELVHRPNAKIDERYLQPGGRIGAVVRLGAGVAVAKSVHHSAAKFVKENVARSGRVNEETEMGLAKSPLDDKDLADWVEVVIDVPTESEADPPIAQLALPLRGQTNGWVLVTGSNGTTLSFSNLCPSGPRVAQRFEFEFAQYYELLEETGSDRLVPMFDHAGTDDCNQPSQMFRYL